MRGGMALANHLVFRSADLILIRRSKFSYKHRLSDAQMRLKQAIQYHGVCDALLRMNSEMPEGMTD